LNKITQRRTSLSPTTHNSYNLREKGRWKEGGREGVREGGRKGRKEGRKEALTS
jgi:hypothetical protein